MLSVDNINPKLVKAEYAVRGYIAQKAEEYRQKLGAGNSDLPFDKVTQCNIGNPQALGQKPITFFRQVLALMDYPEVRSTPSWPTAGFRVDQLATHDPALPVDPCSCTSERA